MQNSNKICLIALLFLIPIGLMSQKPDGQTERKIAFNGIDYLNQYEYQIIKKDTVEDGAYKIMKPIEFSDDKPEFKFSMVDGTMKEGIPDGFWKFRQSELKPKGGEFAEDYHFSFKVDGKENIAIGRFDEYKKEGVWSIYNLKIKDSQVKDTLFIASALFDNNKMIGEFTLKDKSGSLRGEVNSNQYSSGIWKINNSDSKVDSTQFSEEWHFEDHALIKKTYHIKGKKYDLNLKPSGNLKWVLEDIEFSEKYWERMEMVESLYMGYQHPNIAKTIKTGKLLIGSFNDIASKLDTSIMMVVNTSLSPGIKTKVIRLPYTKEEMKELSGTIENISLIDTVIKEIIHDPQYNLVKIKFTEVSRLLSIIVALKNQLITPLEEILTYYQRGDMEYLDRELLIKSMVNFNLKLEGIGNTENEENVYVLKNRFKDENDASSKKMFDLTQLVLDEITVIKDSLEKFVFVVEKEETLLQFEKDLIEKYNHVREVSEVLISSQINEIARFDVYARIIEFIDLKVNKYLDISSPKDKMENVEQVISCIGKVELLIGKLLTVSGNVQIIDDAYTRQVFNPYTFTNMEERIKAPIFNVYKNILLPSIFHNLYSLSCDNMDRATMNFENLFVEMIETLNYDTKKLERRLRNVKDPVKAAEILGFNLNYN